MQATIRLDQHKGRDCGSIVVTDANVVQEPVFYTLQRFTDGKFLCQDAVWRTGKNELRADDLKQKNGVLSIAIGRDILYELDEHTQYRMTINSSKSFPLVVGRHVVRALQGKAALEAYAADHVSAAGSEEGEATGKEDAQASPVRIDSRTQASPKARVNWVLVGGGAFALLLCVGLAASLVKKNQLFEVGPEPISLSATLEQKDVDAALHVDHPQEAPGSSRGDAPAESANASLAATLSRLANPPSSGSVANAGDHLVNSLSKQPFFSTQSIEELHDRHSLLDGDVVLDELEYLTTVRDYVQSGVSTPSMNVLLAKKARYVGASDQETDTAFMLLKDAADQGNVEAMFLLGQYYDPLCPLPRGSIEVNPLEARDWYRRAEAGGLMHAFLSLNALFNYLQKKAREGEQSAALAVTMW